MLSREFESVKDICDIAIAEIASGGKKRAIGFVGVFAISRLKFIYVRAAEKQIGYGSSAAFNLDVISARCMTSLAAVNFIRLFALRERAALTTRRKIRADSICGD